jgi:hypothetical protein
MNIGPGPPDLIILGYADTTLLGFAFLAAGLIAHGFGSPYLAGSFAGASVGVSAMYFLSRLRSRSPR